MTTKKGRQTKADFLGPKRMEEFLTAWANTPMMPPEWAPMVATAQESMLASNGSIGERTGSGTRRLVKQYPELFPELPKRSDNFTTWWSLLGDSQPWLRLAWETTDLRARRWFIYKIRDNHFKEITVVKNYDAMMQNPEWQSQYPDIEKEPDQTFINHLRKITYPILRFQAPPLTAFEQVLDYFDRIADRARRCPNPECVAPFFLAKKRWHKYCGSKCAGPAKREAKRRWWNEKRKGKEKP